MPRRPRPLTDPDHPRRRVLTAATTAFGSNGYERTSMDMIADAAGLPKSGVYYYFPSKQAILMAIAADAAATLHTRLDIIERQSLPATDELRAAILEHARLIIERLPEMRILLREVPPLDPQLAGIAAERNRYRQRLLRIIQRGVSAGAFGSLESGVAVEALIGLVNGLVDWFSPAGPLSADLVIETYARLAVRALQSEPSTCSRS